jgi:hypothetical protein
VTLSADSVANATSAATSPVATPPQNLSAPSIAGRPVVGTKLTAAIGTWNGSKPLSFLYRWDRCLDRVCGVRAVAARTRTYRVRAGDRGRRLRLTVVATNAVGRATASSTPTRTIR